MLTVENLQAGYGDKRVLENVTLEVAAGQFLGLLGPNGCGKTTLLRAIRGTLPPQGGCVRLEGRDLQSISKQSLARTMAYLPQDLVVELDFTVRELALMGRSPHLSRFATESDEDRRAADAAMQRADVLHLADRPVTALSGGERRRALIAMCLAQEPRIFLLDEPTNHLDLAHQLSILDLLLRLNREAGLVVVAVFHDLNLAAEYCDRVLMLDRGQVVAVGPPVDVLTIERIRSVYGVTVSLQRNPISNKPHVVVAGGIDSQRA